jgi:hypothetical protein
LRNWPNITYFLFGALYTSASCIEPKWTQSLQISETIRKGSSIIFILPQKPEFHHLAFPIPKPITAANPEKTWATELGWDDELQQIISVLGRCSCEVMGPCGASEQRLSFESQE